MQCESSNHPSRLSVHQIHIFIARSVATRLKRRDDIAEVLLEPPRRPKGELTNGGVQAVGANHKVKLTFA